LILKNGIGVGDKSNIAGEFDAIGHGLVREMINDGLLKPDYQVLDVGCGLGRLARALTEFLSAKGTYSGIDVNESSIDWCQANYVGYRNFTFVHADVYNAHYNKDATTRADDYVFPFEGKRFDFIFSTSLFTHMLLDGADNYLKEMARVLRPGGAMWNTFMLLDEVSEPLILWFTPQRPNVALPHSVKGGRIALPHDPEALSGLYTERVKEIHARHGLSVKEIRNGPWSARTDNLRASYQDVVIATGAV
jgi:ubiquinone/menaquinone biosynthesis C-methylase UbiE